ncbi:ArsR/SmtB family transcription factor [Georgenia sp. Z1491]|uniref:ArsR/SmtB family transcription factor n=1 Tax=Georgenia sp. Z1491 TaxID=3416707 RepID=UPI003CF728D6
MLDIDLIDDAATAAAALDPVRSRVLAALVEPGSATTLAAHLGLPRQKVNYHLRVLEERGLVELVEERRRGNFTERVVRSRAGSFVISPETLAEVQPNPDRHPDRVSAAWLLALAARLVRDVGALVTGARRTGTRVATWAVDGEVRFASAADRAAFSRELEHAVTDLVRRYHCPDSDGARTHRLVVAVHPHVPTT